MTINRLRVFALAAIALLAVAAACSVGQERDLESRVAPAAGTPAAMSGDRVAALPSVTDADVERLIGMNPAELRRVLGEASFVRHDGPGEIWRYAVDDCFLDVSLFGGQAKTVRHVEARARVRGGQATTLSCYGRIVDQRRASRTEG